MKKILLTFILVVLSFFTAQSQCTITSTDGYTVNVNISVTSLSISNPVPPAPCPNGYNFNYVLSYNITFTGPNAPGSMWTLQGHVNSPSYSSNTFDLPNNPASGSVTSGGNTATSNTNCATVTYSYYNPTIYIIIQGPGISYQVIYCNSSPTPIELLSFTGEKRDEGNYLTWSTNTETNNDYFGVEKSTNNFEWKEIKRVKGAGNSSSVRAYSYTDVDTNGISYYRLKQVDVNATYTYSNVVKIESSSKIDLYPNPVVDNLFHVVGYSDETIIIHLVNALGQEIGIYTFEAGTITEEIKISGQGFVYAEIYKGKQLLQVEKLIVE